MSIGLDPVINGGKGDVSTGYAAGATAIVLAGGEGANFPATFDYNLVWWNSTDYTNPEDDPNVEIVRVTNRVVDTLTVTRGQEGTADVNHNDGGDTYTMILAITKKMIDDIDAHAHAEADATDYTETAIADGEVKRYDGGGWINNTVAELITDINQLGGVTITSVGSNEVLGYSSGWINRTLAEAGIAADGANGDITSLTACTNIDSNGTTLNLTTDAAGEVVINNAQENVDFRVEGDTIDDLLFCDATLLVVGIKTRTPSQYADLTLEGGILCIKETTEPTADTGYFKIYGKADDKLYFQDGGGVEKEVATV